jgi:hypothetical protein
MRSEAPLLRWAVLPVALVAMLAPGVPAQSDRGRIGGLVKDESGAPVLGASVTATNTGTGAVTETTTNSEGLYSGRFEQLRDFGFAGEDLGLMKSFSFGKRYRLQVRLELLNVFNRHDYTDPITDISSPYFGYVTGVTGQPRQGQLGIRFQF